MTIAALKLGPPPSRSHDDALIADIINIPEALLRARADPVSVQ